MSQFRRGRNHQKFLRLAAHWRKANFGRKMAFVLGGLTVLSGAATFAVLSGSWPFPSNTPPYMVLLLLNLDLVLILTLAIIVARKFYRIWAERKSGQAGSRLHIRLMVLFGAVAVFPATLLAIFSG
jgi:two-component system nitrogen regulation sensor histidine kinase NtrY